jgi:hypothetical protein
MEGTMRKTTIALLVMCVPPFALAQQSVDEARPAAESGVVVVDNVAGSVRVLGWERSEVRVTGTLGRGTRRLDFQRAGGRTWVQVIVPRDGDDVEGSDLEVRVPRGSRVEVETVSADVDVDGVTGAVEAESVSGRIAIAGAPSDINVGSVSGDIEIRVSAPLIRAESVSGGIDIADAVREVIAETVSGDLTVSGPSLSLVRISSTSGRARFEGGLAAGGSCDAESVSGPVELVFPAGIDAEFTVKTFSGSILNDFGAKAVRTSEYTSAREMRFSAGAGRGRVTVQTFSGTVRLRQR